MIIMTELEAVILKNKTSANVQHDKQHQATEQTMNFYL